MSIKREDRDMVYGGVVGKVTVCPFKPELTSWRGLGSELDPFLRDELRNGLLTKLYAGKKEDKPSVYPEVLAKMPRKWHIDAAELNHELDGSFASGLVTMTDLWQWSIPMEHTDPLSAAQ